MLDDGNQSSADLPDTVGKCASRLRSSVGTDLPVGAEPGGSPAPTDPPTVLLAFANRILPAGEARSRPGTRRYFATILHRTLGRIVWLLFGACGRDGNVDDSSGFREKTTA
jgi:hypothetical protein